MLLLQVMRGLNCPRSAGFDVYRTAIAEAKVQQQKAYSQQSPSPCTGQLHSKVDRLQGRENRLQADPSDAYWQQLIMHG